MLPKELILPASPIERTFQNDARRRTVYSADATFCPFVASEQEEGTYRQTVTRHPRSQDGCYRRP